MSQQRFPCHRCDRRIAVERGVVRKRIQPTANGKIVTVYDRGVTVQCLACGGRRYIRYTVKQ